MRKVIIMNDDTLQLVEFQVGKDSYGLAISCIQEIIKIGEIVQIPRSNEIFEGVINLRGRIIPVVDLKRRFGLALGERTSKTRIIVSEINSHIVGLIVDDVYEVITSNISGLEIRKITADEAEDQSFIRGIIKHKNRILILLDAAHLLAERELKNIYQLIGV